MLLHEAGSEETQDGDVLSRLANGPLLGWRHFYFPLELIRFLVLKSNVFPHLHATRVGIAAQEMEAIGLLEPSENQSFSVLKCFSPISIRRCRGWRAQVDNCIPQQCSDSRKELWCKQLIHMCVCVKMRTQHKRSHLSLLALIPERVIISCSYTAMQWWDWAVPVSNL